MLLKLNDSNDISTVVSNFNNKISIEQYKSFYPDKIENDYHKIGKSIIKNLLIEKIITELRNVVSFIELNRLTLDRLIKENR